MRKDHRISWIFSVVKMNGLEPSTPCMSSRYSNQLSYTFMFMVETKGFEPSTSCTRSKHSPN